jgi:hypothetical protein
MTPDLTRALAIAGSILMAVVVLIVIISIVTVRRGEQQMAENTRQRGHSGGH